MCLRVPKRVFWVAFLFLIGACGSDTESTPQSIEKQPPGGSFTFDIKDTWLANSKSCDGAFVALKSHEAYKIDKDHFISIERFSESDTKLCRIGYVYDRIISSFETTAGKYTETAVIKGSLAKKTCWNKENGSVAGAPISEEVIDFGPEQANFKLSATSDSVTIDMEKVKECPLGTMQLVLARARQVGHRVHRRWTGKL